MKIAKILVILGFFLSFRQIASAAEVCTAPPGCHCLEIPLGTFIQACGPAEYLTKIYTISIGVAVALAVVMIVYAGIIYITSGDNASKQKEAKSQITQAIFGLALLLASYLILRTVNPDLTNLGKWQNLPDQQVPAVVPVIPNPRCQEAFSVYVECQKVCNKDKKYSLPQDKNFCLSLCSTTYVSTGCPP